MSITNRNVMNKIILFFLVFEMALPKTFVYANSDRQTPNGIDAAAVLQPEQHIQTFLSDLENGRVSEMPNQAFDIFNLADQKIEILGRDGFIVFDMNHTQVDIPQVPFTSLTVKYDDQKKQLVLEGLRGTGNDGSSGVVVARQIINNIDIQSFAKDAELIQIVDKAGRVHAIDMGFVATNAFKSPIPVFKNLWHGATSGLNIRTGFITRGSQGLIIDESSLVPKDQSGGVRLTAGDLYIAEKSLVPGLNDRVIAVLSRDVTYEAIIRGYRMLSFQSALVSPEIQTRLNIEKAIQDLDQKILIEQARVNNGTENPLVKRILSTFNDQFRAHLTSSGTAVGKLSENQRDHFSQQEWHATAAELLQANPSKSSDELERDWNKLISKYKPEEAVKSEPRATTLARLRQKFSAKNSMKILASFLGASSIAYLAYPFVHDAYIIHEQIKVLNWAYENLYPPVLKDAVYRVPLLLSMASLAAIAVEAQAVSCLVGATLRSMADKVKDQTTRQAIYIKDLAKNWAPLDVWQRITTFGMRLYCWLILPYWRVSIEYILRQKTFFSAINNGLNPFQKILASSEMGRKLGLTENQRLGLNAVFSNSQMQKDILANQQIQSALVDQNRKTESMAMVISAVLLGEKYGIDPVTIGQIVENSEQLNLEWLDSPEKQKEWTRLTESLLRSMNDLKNGEVVIDDKMSQLIEKYYVSGRDLLEELNRMSPPRKKLADLKTKFAKMARRILISASNFAVADHEFLKKVFTDKFVSGQVKQEFTVDHMMVVAVVGLYGERADMEKPQYLSAEADGLLWTSKAHWFDIFYNTFIHFFIAGSQTALLFQKVKPQTAKNYGPVENYIYESAERTQDFKSAAYQWAKDVLTPWKADLGGLMIKRFFKRFTTLTAGLTLLIILRWGVFQMPFEHAIVAWAFNFVAAYWFFGWIWDPVQRGNQMEGERIEEMNKRLNKARFNLMNGDEAEGRKEIIALYGLENKNVSKTVNLAAFSKQDLLDITILNPPVYNKANPLLSWVTVWTAAVGSTALAIPLSVILMDPNLLMDASLFKYWLLYSTGMYAVSYAALSKKAWDFYFSRWEKAKNSNGVAGRFIQRVSKHQPMVTCEGLF